MNCRLQSIGMGCLALLGLLFGSNVQGCLTRPDSRDRLMRSIQNPGASIRATTLFTNELSFAYDAYDRMSGFIDAFGNLMQYDYDASGKLRNLVYRGGRNVYYAYDSLNRLTNVTDWAGRQTTIAYDLASRVTSLTRPNHTVRLMNYDLAGELTNIVEKTTSGLPIAFFTLGWTKSGRVAWEFAAPLPHADRGSTVALASFRNAPGPAARRRKRRSLVERQELIHRRRGAGAWRVKDFRAGPRTGPYPLG